MWLTSVDAKCSSDGSRKIGMTRNGGRVASRYVNAPTRVAIVFTDSDQIQRLDFISSHKRWEAEKARQAPELEQDYPDEEVWEEAASSYISSSAPQPEWEIEEADYILAQEENELRQLVASLEEDQGPQDTASQHYGSDDEDYDQIFMGCTTASDTEQRPEHTNASFDDPDAMDTTDG